MPLLGQIHLKQSNGINQWPASTALVASTTSQKATLTSAHTGNIASQILKKDSMAYATNITDEEGSVTFMISSSYHNFHILPHLVSTTIN